VVPERVGVDPLLHLLRGERSIGLLGHDDER
jgi:hypothetical protein